MQVFDEVSGASAAYAAERWEEDKKQAHLSAEAVVDKSIAEAERQQVCSFICLAAHAGNTWGQKPRGSGVPTYNHARCIRKAKAIIPEFWAIHGVKNRGFSFLDMRVCEDVPDS